MFARFYAYIAHPDPVARAANGIAMLIVSNQPFYPLYVLYVVGERGWPAWLTMLSTPFFLAVPWVMRRNAHAGKVLLVLASVGNTVWSIKLLGPDSALELFLLPCCMLAALLFGPDERRTALALTALPIGLFLLLRGRYGMPFETFSNAEYSSLVTLHAFSVACITAFIALSLGAALRAAKS
jgi:hypothetical protein